MAPVKTIQIRNVPDDVHAELRIRAARSGLSLVGTTRSPSSSGTTEKPPISEVLERASKRPGGAATKQIVDAIRAERGPIG